MRKRILSIVLVLALCLTYIPAVPRVYAATYNVTTVDDLSGPFADGDIIVLEADIDAPDFDLNLNSISNTGDININLNGHELTLQSITIDTGGLNFGDGGGGTPGTVTVDTITHSSDTNNGTFLKLNDGVTVVVNSNYTWVSDGVGGISEGSILQLKGNVTMGYFSDSSGLGFYIETATGARVIIDHPDRIYSMKPDDGMEDWATNLADWFDQSLPDHFNVAATSVAINFTNALPDGTTPAYTGALTITGPTADYMDAAATTTPANANPTYNGTAQALYTEGSSDSGTLYYRASSTDPWSTSLPTGTNAGDYAAEYCIAGDATHNDLAAESVIAHINPATVPFFTALPRAIQAGDAMPSLAAPAEGTDYTVTGLISPSDLLSVEMAYVGAPANTETAGEWFDAIQFTNIELAVPGNYNGNPVASANSGTLTITDRPPVSMTAEPQGINDLVYNGSDQTLVIAGSAEGGTMMYSMDAGITWSDALPTGKDANTYDITYRIEPDDTHDEVAAFSGEFGAKILRAPAIIVEANEHATMTEGSAMPALYTANGAKGTDSLDVNIFWPAGDPDTTVAGGPYDFEVNVTGFASGTMDNYEPPYYEVMVPMGQLTVTSGGGGGGGDTMPKESYNFVQPEEGPGSGIMDDENWTWGERGNMTEDMGTLYKFLSNNAISAAEDNDLPYPDLGTDHFLVSDATWTLPDENPDVPDTPVNQALVCQDNEPIYLANGDGKVDQSTFGNSDFYIVGVGTGDSKIDYPNLKTGDVVSNKTFNGVFVTKLQKSNNPTFDADLARLKSETIASFRAFELDHPEVFWLNGSIKLRVLTVTISGEQTSFLFMTLVDDGGFTMRIAEYAEKGAIEKGIAQRDAAVAAIIAQIPAGASDREKVVNLNKWFTLNNEYNRSADLSAIGYTPHRSLKSLTGNFGINGPVCDGYSRGFKTVCDRLGIPVVLETGTASIGSHSELHMWMSIKIDGTWYGTDTTWNDPIVKGKDGKVSGYENEKYLLVGNDTVVDGAKFGVSHPANKTPGGTTGVLFASLILNPNEIYGYVPVDYEDVHTSDWFYDYVQDVTKLNLMNGTSPNLFSPQGTATRGQIVQILYNIAGQPEVEDVKVEGWFGVPATWAMDKGIVAGYPDGDFHGNDPVTREQLATILWAFEGAPEQSGTLSFADADKVSSYAVQALLWAKKKGIIGGKPGNLADPQGTATRAEIATIFSNYMK